MAALKRVAQLVAAADELRPGFVAAQLKQRAAQVREDALSHNKLCPFLCRPRTV